MSNLRKVRLATLVILLSLLVQSVLAQGERPAWQSLALTNARTGESFSLASFEGKTVFVEPMATWCSNCRRQLGNVNAAMADAGEDVVFIALSVEGNLPDETLAQYAEREGFDLMFAVATPDLLSALVNEFGRLITSPPSTPHFVIRPDGTTSALVTGIEPPEAILEQVAMPAD